MVRECRPLHGVRGRAVRLQPADAQPAHLAREPAAARRRRSCERMRELVRQQRRRRIGARAADVHAVHAARRHAAESRRRVADGAVLVRRRHAGRLLPRAPRQPRARRRRARVHRDDVRRPPTRASRPGARGCTSPSTTRRGGASSTTCTRARRRRSRCSSATPGRKARRSSAGRTPTSRCREGNWPLHRALGDSPTVRATRCRAR